MKLSHPREDRLPRLRMSRDADGRGVHEHLADRFAKAIAVGSGARFDRDFDDRFGCIDALEDDRILW